MGDHKERRRHIRKIGQGLIVLIGGRAFPVIDISTSGISFQATGNKVGDKIALKIAQIADIKDCADGIITVKSVSETATRGEFQPTVALMRYIVGHIGDATGTEPAYFRK